MINSNYKRFGIETKLLGEYGKLIPESVFSGKSILITGHTGFKGSWLSIWLSILGAKVHGFSLLPATEPNHYSLASISQVLTSEKIGDIRDKKSLASYISEVKPDCIFHLAAQPLVRISYSQPLETFDVNVMGSINLLESIRILPNPCTVIMVTSDKCYHNYGQVWGYRESDPLGGNDPYSASKAAAEIVIASYRNSFFTPSKILDHKVKIASVRAGNVIGGGDWSPDRIIPDAVKAIISKKPLMIRNPTAIRPWQNVLEPLAGYLTLAAEMMRCNEQYLLSAWNFGPLPTDTASVEKIITKFFRKWGEGQFELDISPNNPPEAPILRLSSEKAISILNWKPIWDLSKSIDITVSWYKDYYSGCENMLKRSSDDILQYMKDMEDISAN
ncbi:CDP-glucose 4,6-dehydratase [uncultured Methanospirillum sp.]|uniref:CDP-glucose 4,6-dehydratase n=1 Tax=uncultured Methanospirillum sp. TaxID=262503 RepID=UPI0029C973E4|nr:CDP-glucose 4,6-dehydratase [uncultured Methanospirillum sp.]